MDAVKFPINSYEIYFMAMVAGVAAYVIGSLIAYRHPYNLERLFHRGQYSIDGEKKSSRHGHGGVFRANLSALRRNTPLAIK